MDFRQLGTSLNYLGNYCACTMAYLEGTCCRDIAGLPKRNLPIEARLYRCAVVDEQNEILPRQVRCWVQLAKMTGGCWLATGD